MMNEIRPEVVQGLLTIDYRQELTPEQAELVHAATKAEMLKAREILSGHTMDLLEQAGAVRKPQTVLDLNQRQLLALGLVYTVAQSWYSTPHDNSKTLGDLMKTMPTEHAQAITDCLVWAGFMEANDEQTDESPLP